MLRELLSNGFRDSVPPPAHEQDFFVAVTDELEGTKEIEAKLGFKDSVRPIPLLTGLVTSFDKQRSVFTPVVSGVFSTTSVVEKYHYEGQNFSVVRRDDGVSFLKVKSNKYLDEGIIVADETKCSLPDGKGIFDLGILAPDIDPEEIQHLGTLHRRKHRIVVAEANRAYQVVCDETHIIDSDGETLFPEADPLQQVEVEYKGTFSLLPPSVSEERLIVDITDATRAIRDEVQEYLLDSGIPAEETTETKTKWLKRMRRKGFQA